MKTITYLIGIFGILVFSACNNTEKHEQHEAVIYTCPMHPEVESFVQGFCPKCKMKLELKTDEVSEQVISPNKQVLSRQSTIKLQTQTEEQNLKAQGFIDVDRTRNKSISARFGGRIEKLFVKYDLQFVKKNAKILELYSPELNTIQEEHIFLLKSKTETTLIEQSRQKLKLLGMTDNQISLLEKNGTFTKTISIYSPSDGYVIFNSETNSSLGKEELQNTSMNSMTMSEKSSTGSSTNSKISEGAYINKGETLFSVNDLHNVWAIVSVSSELHAEIQNNSQVKIISELFPTKPLIGKVALTEQTFEDINQRFIRIRIDLPNTEGALKINSLVTAEIPLVSTGSFQIPVSSVYRTGLSSFVWVKSGTTSNGTGIFKLRKVTTGLATNGMIMVVNGLQTNEEIAEHAGYLTDSETFLNEN
jgi:Cu(I)/Ag(I) efflux system membrane fusion protein